MQPVDHLTILASFIALSAAYLLVGGVFWGMVKARFENDVNAMIMLEQERQGHYAMLIPKFSVIALWPLVGLIALAAAVWHSLRREAPAI